MVLMLSAVLITNAGVVVDVVDEVKLAELRSYLDRPTFEGVVDPTDLLADWYTAW